MTLPTALALIRRLDINRELAAAGRPLTEADRRQTDDLWDRVYVEDVLQGERPLAASIHEHAGGRP
jgi:hypothetical protein